MKSKKTHGETYVLRKENIDFRMDEDQICAALMNLPKKMSRRQALMYYKAKLDFYYEVETDIKRLSGKIEDLYDQIEAAKLLRSLTFV